MDGSWWVNWERARERVVERMSERLDRDVSGPALCCCLHLGRVRMMRCGVED